MKYKVLKTFADLQDNRYLYNVGDTFPHEGIEVSEDRVKELAGSSNRLGTPLIEEIKSRSKSTKKKKVEENVDGNVDEVVQRTE